MANLLLVMSHADTAVKARLCETETLRTLFTAIEISPEALQLTVLKAVKQLTSDPSMLEALEVAPQNAYGIFKCPVLGSSAQVIC